MIWLLCCLFPVSGWAQDAGLLWQARLGGDVVYIFGTSHESIVGVNGVPLNVRTAFGQSNVVLTEFSDVPGVEPAEVPAELKAVRRNYAKDSFALSPEARAKLDKLVDDKLVTRSFVDKLLGTVPLGIFFTLRGEVVKSRLQRGEKFGFQSRSFSQEGYDMMLLKDALQAGKQAIALEDKNNIYRIWALTCETEANHSQIVADEVAAAFDDEYTEFSSVGRLELAVQGKLEELTRRVLDYQDKYPSFRLFSECQQAQRNERWMQRLAEIRQRFNQPKTYFLLTGFGHVLPQTRKNDDSLITLFQRQGWQVDRVPASATP